MALRVNPAAAIAPDGDGYLLFDTTTRRLLHLNPTAALVVELSDGTRSRDQIESTIAPLLGPAGADACHTWIDTSVESGILSIDSNVPEAGVGESRPPEFTDIANTLRREGHVLAAYVCQWHAAHLSDGDATVWYNLGELAHIVGRRAEARDAYEKYLALVPEDEEIAHLLISLRDDVAPARASDRCIEQLYDRFASFYDESMRRDLSYQAPEQLELAIREALGSRTGLAVLELGCGTGLAGRLLRSFAQRLVGIDLSEAMLDRASQSGIYDALDAAEITDWLRKPGAPHFDLIAACDTLIYFGDLTQVIVPARRLLNDGGIIAFTVEDGDTVPFRLTDSGRYAHHESHVREVAQHAGLTVRTLTRATLRYEYGNAVTGLVVTMG
jgi:predicted TPR repeat methyltransferase